MKKIITLSTIAFLSTAAFASTETDRIEKLEAKIAKLEKKQAKNSKKISKVNALAAKDNLKFDVDFRTSYDNIKYKTASGEEFGNDALYSNRLWLGMGYAPVDNMVFKGQLAFNKAFGASYGQRGTGMGFDTFDWVVNENLTDDTLRVREAYWLWTPTVGDFPLTLSVGRRPATNGALINLRDDDKEKSPLGHVINMEFDGMSAGIKLDKFVPGMMFKLCAGRGLTNAASWSSQASGMLNPMFPNTGATPSYASVDGGLDNTDMAGFIFVPYDDGQYQVKTTLFRGFSVPGLFATTIDGATGQPTAYTMESAGNMDGGAASLKIEGIGNEINDFLDETIVFASFAYSQSHPENITRTITGTPIGDMQMTSESMLGSDESKTGHSYWIGTQMPNLTGGRFGLEYNHGSKYWRPFTYGEDTLIGSKMAARGSAIEAYWTQPIIDDVFSMQVRYTKIDYNFTGSGGFFGDGGTPMSMSDAQAAGMDPVESAQDIRVYFRYRY
ncbi:MAG: DUF3373 family protein [Campylobacterota bacterium]|nr:DUF3373 family protein [Campylobacterota bacterium]